GSGGDGGPAVDANLNFPGAVAVDRDGNVYIADAGNNRVRRVDASSGTITTIAGTGSSGSGGDGGQATSATLYLPYGLAIDLDGSLLISDSFNHRIRRIDKTTGIIRTIAGTGTMGFFGDGGPAMNAQLFDPRGIAVDAAGNIFVAEFGNHRVRRIDRATN